MAEKPTSPFVEKNETHGHVVTVRLTDSQHTRLQHLAKRTGKCAAELIRDGLAFVDEANGK